MNMVKLFIISNSWESEDTVTEKRSVYLSKERQIQEIFENNLYSLLGVHLLKPESSISSGNRKRVDSLGIDDEGCPVIIEYKSIITKDVVSQVIEYHDLLSKNQDSFWRRVVEQRGKKYAERINWSRVKMICVAPDFSDRDLNLARAWRKDNINDLQLIRFRLFDGGIIHLEYLNTPQSEVRYRTQQEIPKPQQQRRKIKPKRISANNNLDALITSLEMLFDELMIDWHKEAKKTCINYFYNDSTHSFLSVVKKPAKRKLSLYARIDPSTIELEHGFTRNVKGIGHLGNGDLEISCGHEADIRKAQHLIQMSLHVSGLSTKRENKHFKEKNDKSITNVIPRRRRRLSMFSTERNSSNEVLQSMYNNLEDFLNEIGGDFRMERTKTYVNYIRRNKVRSFLSVVERPSHRALTLFVSIDPTTVPLEPGFTRSVKGKGHLGNGDLEVRYDSDVHFEKAKPLIRKAYFSDP